jgi:hypothetical protein
MAAPSHVFTIAKVAKMLDEDETLLEEIALDMEPEDGRLYICDVDDDVQVTAFTPFQLAHTIRKHRPQVRVVLAAGVPRAAAEAGEFCEQGPMQRKPYDHRTLERHIRRLLAR